MSSTSASKPERPSSRKPNWQKDHPNFEPLLEALLCSVDADQGFSSNHGIEDSSVSTPGGDKLKQASGFMAKVALMDTFLRGHYQFRGHSNASWKLTPGVARLKSEDSTEIELKQEEGIIRNFRKYSSDIPESARDSLWTWLIVAQHYRLKTRLLDWTGSPLTALYFALFREDGIPYEPEPKKEVAKPSYMLWCVNYGAVNRLCPDSVKDEFKKPLKEHFDDPSKRWSHGPWMLHTEKLHALQRAYNRRAEDPASGLDRPDKDSVEDTFFDHFLRGKGDFREPTVFFLQPPSIDARIMAQDASFSFVSGKDQDLEKWLMERTCERHQWNVGRLERDNAAWKKVQACYTWPTIPVELRDSLPTPNGQSSKKTAYPLVGNSGKSTQALPLFYRIPIPHSYGGALRRWLSNIGVFNKKLFPDREGVARYVNYIFSESITDQTPPSLFKILGQIKAPTQKPEDASNRGP